VTNVPRKHIHHSPGGFEFGYAGSGPSDLALNIMAMFCPLGGASSYDSEDDRPVKLFDRSFVSRTAWKLHQDFKFEFIACLDQDLGGVISGEIIANWVQKKVEAQ
jgi:hypothetical protein